MKAAVFHGPKDITVMDVPRPQPGPGAIIVRVRISGICGSDLHTYKLGIFPENSKKIPEGMIMGHEFAGDVVEVGAGVEGIMPGDRVTAIIAGGMAEYVLVTKAKLGARVFKIPPEVGYEEASTVEPMATSLHAAKRGAPADGETIVIIGAGIIGLGIVQSLRAMGVKPKNLIVVDVSDFRLATARQLGATDVVNARSVDPLERIIQLAGIIPFMTQPWLKTPAVDLVYDAVGYVKNNPAPPAIDLALSLVREQGRIVLVGAHEGALSVDFQRAVLKELQMCGSYAYLSTDITESIEYMRQGAIDRKCLITHKFPLDKAREAFETQLLPGETIKVAFECEGK